MTRFRAEDESGAMKEWEVSYEEFERLISTGEADPDIEVHTDNMDYGQWKRLGEMTAYKKAVAGREGGGSLGKRDSVERTQTPDSSLDNEAEEEDQNDDEVPTRYKALRTIAGVFKVLAWLTALVCVIAGIVSIAAVQQNGGGGSGVQVALVLLMAGAIGFVSFYAVAESIIVVIDIEENTRATRSLTQRTLEAVNRLAARPADRKD